MGSRGVWGLGFRVWGCLGFRVQVRQLGCCVVVLGTCGVSGSGFWAVRGLKCVRMLRSIRPLRTVLEEGVQKGLCGSIKVCNTVRFQRTPDLGAWVGGRCSMQDA